MEGRPMKILGIESSCDDTSAAVVEETAAGLAVLSNIVSSQIGIHRLYGGVVPEIAGRAHAENISGAVYGALEAAGTGPDELSAVAVTTHPGLIGALLVGVNFAKAFAFAHSLPLIPVNHIHAHTAAAYLLPEPPVPPFLSLVVSGGHTSFYAVDSYVSYREIGGTRDDAAGEAFDKVGRVMGLPYPAGAAMEELAFAGDLKYGKMRSGEDAASRGRGRKRAKAPRRISDLPSPALREGLDFSFSGLKSASLNFLHSAKMRGESVDPELFASDFTSAVASGISSKIAEALSVSGCSSLVLAGGVAANRHLRAAVASECERLGAKLFLPPVSLCGDNAAMVAAQGVYGYRNGMAADLYVNASAYD